MEPIGKLITARKPKKPGHRTERGDIFDAILSRLNPPRIRDRFKPLTHARLGRILTAIPTKDLYALISKCDDAERRGFSWGAIFWKEIKAPNEGARVVTNQSAVT